MLNEEIVKFDDGKSAIVVKEIGFMADWRLGKLREKNKKEGLVDAKGNGKLEIPELLRECVSKEDFVLLENLTISEMTNVLEAVARVNGWTKGGVQDFPKPSQ